MGYELSHSFERPEKVSFGDGRTADAIGFGNVHLEMVFKVSEPKKSIIYKVLYVPQLTCYLFSVRAIASKGNIITFGHPHCSIRDRKEELRGMGTLSDKLYQLDCVTAPSEQASLAITMKPNNINLWHYRLAHM